ncbi:hypothetical protein ACFY5C_05720 [Streptomyces sp. NPDC012935]|uniref:hypothetical protein n=1 Tax=Streptomyces sp. NPDC012935 TaxID=3364857 RepID=UPI0036A90F95
MSRRGACAAEEEQDQQGAEQHQPLNSSPPLDSAPRSSSVIAPHVCHISVVGLEASGEGTYPRAFGLSAPGNGFARPSGTRRPGPATRLTVPATTKGSLRRPDEGGLPAELSHAASREFLLTPGFPAVHLDIVGIDTRHLPGRGRDGTHYDPNGWDHGAGWPGEAVDSLPGLAVLLGLIAESRVALDSADDAVRVAAATDLRRRLTGVDPLVDDSAFWDGLFELSD